MSLDNNYSSSRYLSLVSRFPMGSGIELVHCPLTGTMQLMHGHKARLLAGCGMLATLAEHASRLCTEFGLEPAQTQNVRQQLEECVDAGLLLPYEALTERLRGEQSTTADESAAITCLGVPTKNRTESLARCVQSYGECARQYGRDVRFMIADDSDTEAVRDANRDALRRIKSELGIEIVYACTKDKQDLARKLAEDSGLPCSMVDFALWSDEGCPTATGSNRNALLLWSVGELLLQVDDDTICRLTHGPRYREGIAITSRSNHWECWFPSANDDTTFGDQLALQDIFAVHEQLLGKSIGACTKDAKQPLNLDGASALLLKGLRTAPHKVLVTSLGLAGDSGATVANDLLYAEGTTRQRLLQSEACYRHALSDHQLVSAVPSLTISDNMFCLYHNIGLDNRQPLPPFMPVCRGEDLVFGTVFNAVLSGQYFGHLPWVVLHKAAAIGKQKDTDPSRSAGHLWFAEICAVLATSLRPAAYQMDSRHQLVKLGKMLAEIGSQPAADFEEFLRRMTWERTSARIAQLDSLLAKYGGQPKYWSDDVKRYQRRAREAMLDQSCMVPFDLSQAFGGEAGLILCQRLIQRFGELLQIWTELRESALDLHKRGYQFGTKL